MVDDSTFLEIGKGFFETATVQSLLWVYPTLKSKKFLMERFRTTEIQPRFASHER